MKILTQKLLSRKLWVSLAGFVTLLVVALGGDIQGAAQVSAIIMAGASVIGYAIGQGLVDASDTPSILSTNVAVPSDTTVMPANSAASPNLPNDIHTISSSNS